MTHFYCQQCIVLAKASHEWLSCTTVWLFECLGEGGLLHLSRLQALATTDCMGVPLLEG